MLFENYRSIIKTYEIELCRKIIKEDPEFYDDLLKYLKGYQKTILELKGNSRLYKEFKSELMQEFKSGLIQRRPVPEPWPVPEPHPPITPITIRKIVLNKRLKIPIQRSLRNS